MIHRVDPPLWLETPHGLGLAHFMIDYGLEHSIYWVVVDEKTGQCWRWENEKVRFLKNITLGRMAPELPRKRR